MVSWPYALVPILLVETSTAFYRGPAKFVFLPIQSQKQFSNTSFVECNKTLAEYQQRYDEHLSWRAIANACNRHQNCILTNTDENGKAYSGSAALLIGLTPMLLSSIGPTISELGLLSLNRPILTLLLVAGTAAIYPSRVLSYSENSPSELLARPPIINKAIVTTLQGNHRLRLLISALQYLMVMAAVVNVSLAAWELGKGTVSSFQCQVSYLPLLWTLLPLAVYLSAAIASRLAETTSARTEEQGSPTVGSRSGRLLHWLTRELKPGATQATIRRTLLRERLSVAIWLGVASALAFVHSIFGIFVFSSLLFGMIVDALVLLLRFVASVFICRLVIIFEISCMRAAASMPNTCAGSYEAASGSQIILSAYRSTDGGTVRDTE
ncbi:hypothetical protein PGQ11_007738 [Apiospora arundinis]|uniref:Uncharacterized protein n=1 Tax=Apiospora arundinis TaxID=335852 RepID=A0ABR2IX18_9PEZI